MSFTDPALTWALVDAVVGIGVAALEVRRSGGKTVGPSVGLVTLT